MSFFLTKRFEAMKCKARILKQTGAFRIPEVAICSIADHRRISSASSHIT